MLICFHDENKDDDTDDVDERRAAKQQRKKKQIQAYTRKKQFFPHFKDS